MAKKSSKNPLLILAGIVVLLVGIGLGAMEISKSKPGQPQAGGKEHSTRAGYYVGGAIPLAAILIALGMGVRVS